MSRLRDSSDPDEAPPHEVDLHGLRPEDALRRAAREIHACRVRRIDRLKIITGKGTLVVERAPIGLFARAVGDESDVYQNADAARGAGFDGVPAPPTFGFSIQNWGKWAELQPPDGANADGRSTAFERLREIVRDYPETVWSADALRRLAVLNRTGNGGDQR